ncbi:MAG: phosphomannomutase/phosphoglucomutase [Candidatus Magasanikbacteria bacterium]
MFPSHIFKAYDIRGLVEGDLSEKFAYTLGQAFVYFLKEQFGDFAGKSVVVGRDMRDTSPAYQNEVIRGMVDLGVSVVDIGLTSTPIFNFACANYPEYIGGIMVTASHNPSEYNGFKITLENGLPVGKENGMERIKELAEKNNFELSPKPGAVIQRDVRDEYIERIFSLVDIQSIRSLKIVIDGGNGMAKVSFPRWLEKLPVEVTYLYMEPDGRFPNHEANPLKVETLKDLQAKVREVGADFGFALDGDADRIGLVDEKGIVVGASEVATIIGKEVLKRNPNIHMLYDLRSSHIVKEAWEENEATTEMCMVGHALIKKMMRDTNAHFASELSLHLYFKDMYYLESSDLCLLYLLELLSKEQKTLSQIVAPLKKYAHSGEINFEVEDKDAVIERIRDTYKTEALEISDLDGLWMQFPWGWFSVRKSNTEPVLRLNLEAGNESAMKQKLDEVKALIS